MFLLVITFVNKYLNISLLPSELWLLINSDLNISLSELIIWISVRLNPVDVVLISSSTALHCDIDIASLFFDNLSDELVHSVLTSNQLYLVAVHNRAHSTFSEVHAVEVLHVLLSVGD